MKKILTLIMSFILTFSLTACGSANTRYLENSSDYHPGYNTNSVSYETEWVSRITNIDGLGNQLKIELVNMKTGVNLETEHMNTIDSLEKSLQSTITDLSGLQLSYEDTTLNTKRIDALKNIVTAVQDYRNVIIINGYNHDAMQQNIDTIIIKIDSAKNIVA